MDVFNAVADPVRREILMLLRDGEMTAGEIAHCFEISRPAVSRHLRVLREAGLVTDQSQGRRRVYRLDASPVAVLDEWLQALRSGGWSQALDALETEVYRTRRERRAPANDPDRRSA